MWWEGGREGGRDVVGGRQGGREGGRWWEGGREGGREGRGREGCGGREAGREGGREGGREAGREGGGGREAGTHVYTEHVHVKASSQNRSINTLYNCKIIALKHKHHFTK